MKKININFGRVAFLLCNFVLLLSGVCLVLLGCILVNDTPRILLSRLVLEPKIISQPLLYYVALGFITLGLIVCAVAMLGCWASCDIDSNWLLGLYMFLLIVLLLAETSFGAVASLCPEFIGVGADRDQMVTSLMNNYGVPGRSQYTTAVDLAQTLFECCGMQSGSDYDGSKWWRREQETQHDLRVPHSCCFLTNIDEENSFLDPKPVNSSLCQAKTNSRYQYGRHVKGCIDKLNEWFKELVTIFLIIGLALIIVQLSVLLCAILVCLRKRKTEVSPLNIETSRDFNSKMSKRGKRSEKNQTPRPERRKGVALVEAMEDNGFVVAKSYDNHADFQSCPETRIHTSKKINSDEDFGEVKGRDSPSSLPLVLRNDHFRRFEKLRTAHNATNSTERNSWVQSKYSRYDQGPNVYFTPHYYSAERINRMFYNNADDDKLAGDLKTYFYKNENHGTEKKRYENSNDS